jgi:hypothetical protein
VKSAAEAKAPVKTVAELTVNEWRKPVGRGVGGRVLAHAAELTPELFPTAQLAQLVAPDAAAYVPAAHSTQTPARTVAYVPAAQSLQLDDATAPSAAEAVPAGHAAQIVAPITAVNVPERHTLQATAASLALYWPAAHAAQADSPVEGW